MLFLINNALSIPKLTKKIIKTICVKPIDSRINANININNIKANTFMINLNGAKTIPHALRKFKIPTPNKAYQWRNQPSKSSPKPPQ